MMQVVENARLSLKLEEEVVYKVCNKIGSIIFD